MSSSTATYTTNNAWSETASWTQAQVAGDPNAAPIYNSLSVWFLLLPLLFIAANGMPSLLNLGANSADMTQNAYLIRTAQGIRPQVIWYYLTMAGYVVVGYKLILRAALQNRLLLLAPAFAALTAGWSESPTSTLRTSIDLVITTAFALYLSERFSTERLMKILVLLGWIAAILSLGLVILAPAVGIYHRDGSGAWQGIFSHKNFLGVGMAFFLTPIFFTPGKLAGKIAYSITSVFLVAMSQSRGAWFVTAGVLLFAGWIALSRRMKKREFLLSIVATTAIAFFLVALGVAYYEPLMHGIGKDPTMTGRTDIYAAVLQSILKHPALGYGFGAFWFINPEAVNIGLQIRWPSIGYAENGILEMGLQVGIVGLALIFIPIFRAIGQGLRLLQTWNYNPRVGWFCTILFLELATNIEAGSVLAPTTLSWTLTIIAIVGLANEYRNRASAGVAHPTVSGQRLA
jgi:exopolysaccharide production protein ExoQ